MEIDNSVIAAEEIGTKRLKGLDALCIHSIETFGTHDGPGIRMVVFTQGCQFRCLYCANPDTPDVGGGKIVSLDEIVNMAVDMKPYFNKRGGVTISGGEPSIQAKNVKALFERLHEEGINTALDSNGSMLNADVMELLDKTDLLLLDVKHVNDGWHRKITRHSNHTVLNVARYRQATGKRMWLRYVLVPGLSDQEEYLHELGQHFKDYSTIEKIEIQPYHTLGIHKWEAMDLAYKLKDVHPPSHAMIEKAVSIFKQYFKEVKVN
jgi:pyruvate formate lyase activating enzyme